ncbi:MAG: iron-sulfur cluster carrier protein ApbC [Gammaproteobacteria bacterium]|nr:iron-sulfur cluster carrier protein ApbC [Gammaproteobacteria bacterium]
MTDVMRRRIEEALKQVVDVYLGIDLVSAKVVKQITVENNAAQVKLVFGYPAGGYASIVAEQVRSAVAQIPGVTSVGVNVTTEVVAHSVQRGVKLLQNVKNIIAVASGKGGVGKSTTAVNLALALAQQGGRVGILDADIYGPSQPRMLGIEGKPESKDGKTMEPLLAYGVQAMSIGFLIDEETPMIWRGPMVTQALEQLLRETNWQNLDYLVIDLPPGTGDIQLTLSQKIPVSGAVIVTTPQDIALLDARKGLKMFEKVEVPVLGIIENMSTHICSQCGHEEHIFGEGGGQRMAQQYGIELLGSLPLDIRIREDADGGRPSVVAEPEGTIAQAYSEIARKIAAKLSLRAKDFTSKFPNIVIQQT